MNTEELDKIKVEMASIWRGLVTVIRRTFNTLAVMFGRTSFYVRHKTGMTYPVNANWRKPWK